MPRPRTLLIGRNGQVAWELRRALAPLTELICLGRPQIDLCHPESLRQCVRGSGAQFIINAAAYTAVDRAEAAPDVAMVINGQAPGILAEEAKRLGALLVHYSTDYVFDGTKSTPYVETDATNPLNAYGRSKLAGEQAIQAASADYLIFRLCWVYGTRGENFMVKMMRLAREREELCVVNDQIGCPTWSRMIAQATALAVCQTGASRPSGAVNGIYHLAASGSTSWHGFAEAIVDLIPSSTKKCARVKPISSSEYPTPTKRPSYSVLGCGKLERTFGLRLPGWQESLIQVLEEGSHS